MIKVSNEMPSEIREGEGEMGSSELFFDTGGDVVDK
jgi:hypothetical protein